MIQWMDLPVLGTVAFASAFLGSVAGSGGSAVLLPALVFYFGIRDAMAIITIANLSANLSRSVINWRDIDFSVVGYFVLGTIPTSVLGSWLFTVTPPEILTRMLGVLLIALVLWRRLRPRPPGRHHPGWFLPLGAVFGFLQGMLSTTGPLMAPFFLAYGLMRGAYIGTDALATSVMQSVRLAVFGHAEMLGAGILAAGLVLVPFMVLGTLAGKKLLDRVSDALFALVLELMLIGAGLNFLIRG